MRTFAKAISSVAPETDTFLLDSGTSTLREFLDGRERPRETIARYAGYIATWHLSEGLSAVLDGDLDGWRDAHHGFLWQMVSTHVGLEALRVNSTFTSMCHTIAAARVLGWDVVSSALASKVSAEIRGDGFDKDAFETRDVEPFILAHCDSSRETREYWVGFDFGEYRFVQEAIDASRELIGDEVSELCDYHCEQIDDDEDEALPPPFVGFPWDVFPVEILLTRMVFESSGLGFPECDHPLLATPLSEPPPIDASQIDDPLMLDVATRVGFTEFMDALNGNEHRD